MPMDNLQVNLQLASKIEECSEYIEDPEKLLARNLMGQLYRVKLKITLSYQQPPGQYKTGFFKNV